MATMQTLQMHGWYLTQEGVQECLGNGNSSTDSVIKSALDMDLKHTGEKHLPEGINRGKVETVDGPFVMQIQKIRNVTAPKENEESQGAPQMLKLTLTDGHLNCIALQMDNINKLSLNTPPGCKVKLTGKVPVNQGFLLLNNNNCQVLGGHVDKLVENWELKRSLAKHTRSMTAEGGPPLFIPFGQRQRDHNRDHQQYNRRDNFKSLEAPKEKKENDTEFEQQRQASIQAAMQTNKTESKKSFGAGSMTKGPSNNDREVAKIVEMGFTAEQATSSLRLTNGNVQEAIDSLLQNGTNKSTGSGSGSGRGKVITDTRSVPPMERREERGRKGKGREKEEEGFYDNKPSAPATLFDFLTGKIPAAKEGQTNKSSSGNYHHNKQESRENSHHTSVSVTASGAFSGPDQDGESSRRTMPNLPPRLQRQQNKRDNRDDPRGGGRRDMDERGGRGGRGGRGTRGGRGGRPDTNRDDRRPRDNRNDYGGRDNRNDYGKSDYGRSQDYGRHDYGRQDYGRSQDYGRRDYGGRQDYNNYRGQDYGDRRNDYGNSNHDYNSKSYDYGNRNQDYNRGMDYSNHNQDYSNRNYEYSNKRGQGPRGGRGQDNSDESDRRGGGKNYNEGRQRGSLNDQEDKPEKPPRYNPSSRLDGDPSIVSVNQQPPQPKPAAAPPAPPVMKLDHYGPPPSAAAAVLTSSAQPGYSASMPNSQVQISAMPSQPTGPPPNQVPQVYSPPDAGSMVSEGQTVVYSSPQTLQYSTTPLINQQLIQQVQDLSLVSSAYSVQQHGDPVMTSVPPGVQHQNMHFNSVPRMDHKGHKHAPDNRVLRHWKPGDFCMARYWHDGKYYRAMIQAVVQNGQACMVTFPDYGNTERVPLTEIRAVNKQAWESNSIQGQIMDMIPATGPPTAAPMTQPTVMNPNMVPVSLTAPAMIVPTSPTMTYVTYPNQVPPTDQPFQGQITGLEFYQSAGGIAYPVSAHAPQHGRNNQRPAQQYYLQTAQRNM